MNIYKISPDQEFISTVAEFILGNFRNLELLKVILPNGYACLKLQQKLVERQGATILPSIIPFFDITTEAEEIFRLTSEQFNIISALEEKIIISDIIFNYSKFNFSFSQALQFSHTLSNLLYEFSINKVDFENINEAIPLYNKAEHWQLIYEFLIYFHNTWKQAIKTRAKTTRAEHMKTMLNAEVQRISNTQDNILIIAGILGQNTVSWEFLRDSSILTNAYIILPPTPDSNNTCPTTIPNSLQDDSTIMFKNGKWYNRLIESDNIYCLNRLLSTLGKQLDNIKTLPNKKLDARTELPFDNHHLNYIEFDNIFQEADKISLVCKQNCDKKIAIILTNTEIKEYYINFLIKYSLDFQDLLGHNLSKTEIFNFILCVSELFCCPFELQKLLALLKSPLVLSDFVFQLEQLLLAKNRFISDWAQILSLLKVHGNDEMFIWFSNITNAFCTKPSTKNFSSILTKVIHISELLYPKLWSRQYAFEISEFFRELINIGQGINCDKIENFPEYLKLMSSQIKIFNHNTTNAKIVICKPNDAFLLKFDIVIIPDFNEGSWPLTQSVNPWLNKSMQETLGLYSEHIKSNTSLYMLYLLLHNNKVLLTRSKKYNNKSEILPSNYLLKLNTDCNFSEYNNGTLTPNQIPIQTRSELIDLCIKSQSFPHKISASDIETLVRSPYSFYAKKILNLKDLGSISSPIKLSEFGSFVHKVIEEYTKHYSQDTNNKLQSFIDYGVKLIKETTLFELTKKLWITKISAIAEEFIEFDEQRRKKRPKIYAELPGKLLLNIGAFDLQITAIADRIEVINHKASILDYKTGALPTKKEVQCGLSPQLIICALICQSGGFDIGELEISEIVYVKISSSKPYIRTTIVELTNDDIVNHKAQMQSFLEYYINSKTFSKAIDLSKYNDYTHLARTLNN